MRSKLRIAVLIFSSLLLVACEPSVKNGLSHDEYVKLAREYKNNGDYDRAIAAGKKAVGIKPQDGDTHYLLAMLYYEGWRKSHDTAQMKVLQEAMLNPNKRRYSNETEELKKFGLKAEWKPLSNQAFKETIKYDPKNWFARYMIATDYFNNKHFKESIEDYKKVISINPNYVNSYSLMGEAYSELGEYSQALQYLQTAVKMDPKGTYTLLQLGRVYKKMEDWGNAAKIKKQLIDMNASYGDL